MKDISTSQTDKKDKFLCKVAGLIYEIEYEYPYTKAKYRDYIIESAENAQEIISITYTEKDIEEIAEMTKDIAGEIAGVESDAYREYACIFDKIASKLPDYNRLLMHGALIEYEGEGFIFAAPSGTGKTTHISLWKKYLKDKAFIVNGDKPVLTLEGDNVVAYGTPWCGKEGWQINKSVPLKGICLVRRGKENIIKEVSAGEYIEYFIKQFYFDFQSEYTLRVFAFYGKLAERVPFYLLECDISEDAAKTSFEKMTGKEWRRCNED